MKTNDLKSGNLVLLRNGNWATLKDNKKGNTRIAEVRGQYTETGSLYAHDIIYYMDKHTGELDLVEHTQTQIACRKMVNTLLG